MGDDAPGKEDEKEQSMFAGVYTALVTPFRDDGSFDEDAYRALIDAQVEGGVDGIVPVGTTGESPTLDFDEHHRVIEVAIAAAAGRVKVIAGTGGNATAEALRLTRRAKDAGADGTLQVTPYYNKPSQAGLIRHFSAVADVGLPVVLYNVPGRTSLAIDIETVATLSEHPHITTIKEAGGSVDRVSHLRRACDIEIISGDDMLTLPMMMVGAVGVISVAANIIPGPVSEMVHAAQNGQWEEARELHATYHSLFCDLFMETNPQPVKTALAMMGQVKSIFRLPLCEMSAANAERLRGALDAYGLL